MTNPHGMPIWYELMTTDPDGAKRFYDDVAGWTIEARPSGEMDYRMIAAAGGLVGGVFRLTEDMRAQGAEPRWVPYFGVEDVDAAFAKAKDLGAQVFVPPTDIPGVGRFALIADPQGAPLYLMRGSSAESSSVFARGEMGRCGWNELWTRDVGAALAFYGPLLGVENRETMDMGPMAGYHFLDLGAVRIGALAQMKDEPARWILYFTVPDLDRAGERVSAGGGVVQMGPHTVPTGERILIGADPQGAAFALVSPA